jgi:hypothetical protein
VREEKEGEGGEEQGGAPGGMGVAARGRGPRRES